MLAQIKPWGNSQAVRLPKNILDITGIKSDDYLQVEIINGDILLKKQFTHKTLEQRAEEYGGKLGPYTEMNFGEPVGRERV